MDRAPLPMYSDEVLDLSKTNVKKEDPDPEYKSYTMPLTPPHSYPLVPLALRYPVPVMPCNIVTDSSEDTSDISNSSPPAATISSTFMLTNSLMNATRSGKPTRPFKAYPRELLTGTVSTDIRLAPYHTNNYLEFRQRMLAQIKSVSNKSNANMKRSNSPQQPTSVEDDLKSSAYWERRRKNNEAAKRSRDARREKEDEIAIRAAYLEQECTRLQNENSALKEEVRHFRYMFCKLGNR